MTRARQVGDAKAAAEFEVTTATVRKWRSRLKQEPAPASPPAAVDASDGSDVAPTVGVSALEDMHRALASARRVEAKAMAQTEALLAAGDAGEARNAAAAAGVMSDKALALGRALATAEAEAERAAARLDEERLELWRGMLRKAFEAADVPVPVDALRELAACAAEGRQLEVSEEVARASRDAVRLRVGGELRLEIEAEFAEREADEANEHGDKLAENGSAPPEPYVASALAIREPARADHGGGEIGWEDVRQEFRKRYVQREQAIVAEAETREREQRERERQDAGLGGGGRRVRWHAEAFGAGRHR